MCLNLLRKHKRKEEKMRQINEIIIHCSATKEGADIKAADIKRWHTAPPPKGNGWKDIGYHYVVDIDGTIELGRPLDQTGAHTKGHNANTIGICYVGGLDLSGKAKDTRTTAQKAAIEKLITALKVCFPTICKVSGHRDYAAKACPCFDAKSAYQKLVL